MVVLDFAVLQEAVQAAQKFNSSPSRRLTAGQSLHQDLGKSRRGGRRQSIQESEIQAEPSATGIPLQMMGFWYLFKKECQASWGKLRKEQGNSHPPYSSTDS